MRFNIRQRRKAAGFSQEHMAELLNISTGLYNGLETGKRRMNETYLEGIANIFQVPVSALLEEDRAAIKVIGELIEDAEIFLPSNHERLKAANPKELDKFFLKGGMEYVSCPLELPAEGVAAVKVGQRMTDTPYSAGDILFFDFPRRLGVPSDAINKLSVCADRNGNFWLRRVIRADRPDTFHLIAPTDRQNSMHDIELLWAGPIELHWPAKLVRSAPPPES
ncbi:helix-turn-helix domain-containing protein [Pseudooceanicola nanhaiensis]|uniref:helix-turn-helix domain-containing protein n=1 Tax=Pseudooceanicola nanhaiensis TaxID=375761 RepID=UPI001CD25C5D|nr:helix-turn-helix transcriptional regulator [Pseudooceanicola nanhaiensis]MCA0919692.1 helix-turn-helix domain-containing protein [Pseudooceanicola nanhaiensis]